MRYLILNNELRQKKKQPLRAKEMVSGKLALHFTHQILVPSQTMHWHLMT